MYKKNHYTYSYMYCITVNLFHFTGVLTIQPHVPYSDGVAILARQWSRRPTRTPARARTRLPVRRTFCSVTIEIVINSESSLKPLLICVPFSSAL